MPAYMAKKLIPVCRGLGCAKQATYSVHNNFGEFVGDFCRACGEKLLKQFAKEIERKVRTVD